MALVCAHDCPPSAQSGWLSVLYVLPRTIIGKGCDGKESRLFRAPSKGTTVSLLLSHARSRGWGMDYPSSPDSPDDTHRSDASCGRTQHLVRIRPLTAARQSWEPRAPRRSCTASVTVVFDGGTGLLHQQLRRPSGGSRSHCARGLAEMGVQDATALRISARYESKRAASGNARASERRQGADFGPSEGLDWAPGEYRESAALQEKRSWSAWPDLNWRPLVPQTSALTRLRHTPTVRGILAQRRRHGP